MTPPGHKSMKAIEDFYIKENVIDCLVMQNEYKNEFNNFNQSKRNRICSISVCASRSKLHNIRI